MEIAVIWLSIFLVKRNIKPNNKKKKPQYQLTKKGKTKQNIQK